MMAPLIAALIKGGLSVLAGAVASKGQEIIQEKLGVDIGDLVGSEQGRIQLKELEMRHQEFLINAAQTAAAQDLDYFKAEIDDRKSAREREVKLAEASPSPWWAPSNLTWLSWLIILGGGWIFYNTAETDIRYAVVSIVTMVVGYHFGTSRTSHDKDRTFADLLKGGMK